MNDIITAQIKSSLENKIFDSIISQNTGISSPILRAVVSRVAEQAASSITTGVNLNANEQLNTIPQNLLGVKNPVDIVSKNLSSTQLTNNLNNILTTQLSSQVTNLITSRLEGELKRVLPKNQQNLINFNGLAAGLIQSITPTIGSSITSALTNFSTNLFDRSSSTSVIPNISNIFEDSRTSEEALLQVDSQLSATVASSALNASKNFNLNNEVNLEKLEVLHTGFTDPNANYPTKEYFGQIETNKLAQGDARGTVVIEKNKQRMLGAKLPGGDSWDQPESPFKGEYPYNKVTQTEQGHIIEVDDTPGSERLHVYHKSGTFIEIDANGSVVKRAVGSSYEIIDKNGKISIAGKADISINGACNIFVGNDANIEVEGDVNLTCHNDITAMAGGTLNMSAKEEVNITGGNVNVQAYYSMNQKAGDILNLHSSNVMYMKSNVDMHVQADELFSYSKNEYCQTEENLNVNVGGSLYTSATNDINQKSSGITVLESLGNFNLQSSENLYVDAVGDIRWAEGLASSSEEASLSKQAVIAMSSNIGVLSGRKDVFDNSKTDPSFLTLADKSSILLEEETQTGTDYNTHKDLIVTSGFATATEIDAPPIVLEKESVSSNQSITADPDQALLKYTELPGNFNLSPNFTVEMLSSKAAVTKDKIEPNQKITYGEIIFNLSAIALNVLEPIYKLYPNMFVTSAYRNPNNKSNAATSQHPLGQAVDIQFKGISKSEYYEIAKLIGPVIVYDQLILEFCNYTKNPWIHISYASKNRKQVLTFFNHRKHSDGLTQLA